MFCGLKECLTKENKINKEMEKKTEGIQLIQIPHILPSGVSGRERKREGKRKINVLFWKINPGYFNF